ncbi:MAG: hypothetical protein ABW179_08145 [Methylobacterium sp.]
MTERTPRGRVGPCPDGTPFARAPSLPCDSASRDAGFALLAVLLAAALFTAAAASFAVRSRLLAMQEANRQTFARDEALVDGAALFMVDRARDLALATAGADAAPASAFGPPGDEPGETAGRARGVAGLRDGAVLVCALPDGRRLELRAVDQAGLLDLNAAPREMIVDVLAGAGFEPAQAQRLANGIVDFRDEDDVPQDGGASERAAYVQAGLSWAPRNGAFLDGAEIAELPSVTPPLLVRLRPLVTTFNGTPSIDFAVMAPHVRALFPRRIDPLGRLAHWHRPTPRANFAVEAKLRRADGSLAAGRFALVTFDPALPGHPILTRWQALSEIETLEPANGAGQPPSTSPVCTRLGSALALANYATSAGASSTTSSAAAR